MAAAVGWQWTKEGGADKVSNAESFPISEDRAAAAAEEKRPVGMPRFSDSAKSSFEAALQRQYTRDKGAVANAVGRDGTKAATKKQADGKASGGKSSGRGGRAACFTHGPDYSVVSRNLALELVRVTEAAALNSAQWMGLGDKRAADQAAVDAMRLVLNTVIMDGKVVIGEGEKDEAPMLFSGEYLGDGSWPAVDIAVDPLDGTSLVAKGKHGAITVIALAERGAMFSPGKAYYMNKLCVPYEAAGMVDIDAPVARNVKAVADALGKDVCDISVAVLDRPRHSELIYNIRRAGARVHLIDDGDVAAALAAATPGNDVDMLMGIGGSAEGVITAAAMRCLGGEFQGKLWARDEAEAERLEDEGFDLETTMTATDLCRGEQIFFAATGVSTGDLLKGVRFTPGGALTSSLVMRAKSGTVRSIETTHRF
eukprot:PRCOL_00000696-RA